MSWLQKPINEKTLIFSQKVLLPPPQLLPCNSMQSSSSAVMMLRRREKTRGAQLRDATHSCTNEKYVKASFITYFSLTLNLFTWRTIEETCVETIHNMYVICFSYTTNHSKPIPMTITILICHVCFLTLQKSIIGSAAMTLKLSGNDATTARTFKGFAFTFKGGLRHKIPCVCL